MKPRLICAITLCLLMIGTIVHADIKQHPIGLQIWVPDTWTSEVDEDLLMITSPDEGAIIILLVLDSADVDMAMDEMDKELNELFRNIRLTTQAEEILINGVRGVTQEGTATTEGVQIDWISGLFPYRNQALMVLGFAESAKFASHEQMLVEIFSSLKPY